MARSTKSSRIANAARLAAPAYNSVSPLTLIRSLPSLAFPSRRQIVTEPDGRRVDAATGETITDTWQYFEAQHFETQRTNAVLWQRG